LFGEVGKGGGEQYVRLSNELERNKGEIRKRVNEESV
jgi:hypothetical protein